MIIIIYDNGGYCYHIKDQKIARSSVTQVAFLIGLEVLLWYRLVGCLAKIVTNRPTVGTNYAGPKLQPTTFK